MLRQRRLLMMSVIVLSVALGFTLARPAPTDAKALPNALRVPVLMYHYIDTAPKGFNHGLLDLIVAPEDFRAQMKWLKDNGYNTISPDMLLDALLKGAALPAKPVMITFDDGYLDAYTVAFPVLRENGFTATFFIVTGFADSGNPTYMTWPMIKALSNAGMSIEGHTATHEKMYAHSVEWLKKEVDDSLKEIEAKIGVKPLYFAYPYGVYDDLAVLEVKKAGIIAAFTTRGSSWINASQLLVAPRMRVRGNITITSFANMVQFEQ